MSELAPRPQLVPRATAIRALDGSLPAARSCSSSWPWSAQESIWRSRFLSAVFPATNFPRIVVGVDNGVMPIDQMQVTVTRPIEEAVNSVPGLDHVRSVTSRGSAEIDLFFNWNVDMFQTLQYVNAALARVQPTLPPTATDHDKPADLRGFPDHGI